jgi:putative membrane protein
MQLAHHLRLPSCLFLFTSKKGGPMMGKHVLAGLVAAGLSLVCYSGLSLGEEKRGEERARDKAISAKAFVQRVSRAGMDEVKLARLAEERASNADVKKFARHMVENHGRINKELMALADSKGIRPAKQMDEKHQALADQLGRLEGPAFDRRFMASQVKDHEEAVHLFQAYSRNGDDAELKSFATKALPKLKEHLSMAQEVAAKVGAGREGREGTGTRLRDRQR